MMKLARNTLSEYQIITVPDVDPHAQKRNPTLATKSTATPPKANYRNPPTLDREPRFLIVVATFLYQSLRLWNFYIDF